MELVGMLESRFNAAASAWRRNPFERVDCSCD
jgi:hypothetical protein